MSPGSTPRRRLIFPLFLLFVFAVFPPVQSHGQGFVRTRREAADYSGSPSLQHLWHWGRFPVRVFVATHTAAEEQAARAALAGFDEWVQATNGAVRYTVVDSPARADITVRFDPGTTLPGQPGVAGETAVSSSRSVLRKAAMTLAFGGATPEEFQSVAAHEFGHALGIGGHSDDPSDLMYPVEVRFVSPDDAFPAAPAHPVTTRDLNTLRLCYPGLLPPPAPRTAYPGATAGG